MPSLSSFCAVLKALEALLIRKAVMPRGPHGVGLGIDTSVSAAARW